MGREMLEWIVAEWRWMSPGEFLSQLYEIGQDCWKKDLRKEDVHRSARERVVDNMVV